MSVDMLAEKFSKDIQEQMGALRATWDAIVGQDKSKSDALRSTILHTVPISKLDWSEEAGYDIGTPATVDLMIERQRVSEGYETPNWQAVLSSAGADTKPLRDMLIIANLTGFASRYSFLNPRQPDEPVFSSGSGELPIYGELIRWEARQDKAKWKILPDLIEKGAGTLLKAPYVLANYCEQNKLGGFYAFLQAAAMEKEFWHINHELTNAQERSLEAAVGKR